MNKENCALKLVDEIILYYDARSKKYQNACRLSLNFSCKTSVKNVTKVPNLYIITGKFISNRICSSTVFRIQNKKND